MNNSKGSLDSQNNQKKPLCLMFLNQDFGEVRTGIENAALLRKKLFQQFLDISPTVITLKHRTNSSDIRQLALQNRLLESEDVMLNMYEHFQGLSGGADIEVPEHMYGSSLRSESVAGTPGDERVYDAAGDLVMYIFRSRITGKVQYINYMNGLKSHKKWRREHFHPQGFVNTAQFIDGKTDQTEYEYLHRPDGTLAIARYFHLDGQEKGLAFIQCYDGKGRIVEHFKTERDLLCHWLPRLINDVEKDYCLILDRPGIYYEALKAVRKEIDPRITLKIVPIIHAVHVNDATKIGSSRSNKNYKAVLDDISDLDALVTLTDEQATDMVLRYGDGNVKVIPHAYLPVADEVDFSNRETLSVVYLARYAAEKQHSVALDAFGKVVKMIPSAKLHLYGSGSKRKEIEEHIKTSCLEQSIFVHDFSQNSGAIFAKAGVSILTSTSESFSLSVLESLAHGCPVVAFDVPYGPRALIENGINGFLIPFGDSEQFADRLAQILRDPILHERMSRQARRSAERFFPESVAPLWAQLLEELFPAGALL